MESRQSTQGLSADALMLVLKEAVRIMYADHNPDQKIRQLRQAMSDAAKTLGLNPAEIRLVFDQAKNEEKKERGIKMNLYEKINALLDLGQEVEVPWSEIIHFSLLATASQAEEFPNFKDGLVYMANHSGREFLRDNRWQMVGSTQELHVEIVQDDMFGCWYGFSSDVSVEALRWTSGRSGARVIARKKENCWTLQYEKAFNDFGDGPVESSYRDWLESALTQGCLHIYPSWVNVQKIISLFRDGIWLGTFLRAWQRSNFSTDFDVMQKIEAHADVACSLPQWCDDVAPTKGGLENKKVYYLSHSGRQYTFYMVKNEEGRGPSQFLTIIYNKRSSIADALVALADDRGKVIY